RKHKFHPRPYSPLHLPNEEPILGYLKFSAKGTKREVFGMPILVTKLASSQQPEPKPALAKSQGKKCKLVRETSDKPSSAGRSKPGLVTKRSKPTISLRVVDKFVDEGIPEKEPRFNDQDDDEVSTASRGSGKGQREKSSGHDESSPLYAKLGLTDSEMESDAGVQGEGQDGPNPGEQDEGQARPNPGDVAVSQPQSSLVLHVRPNLKHMDLEATDVILEEPASLTGTFSSLKHLAKDLSFGDLFFNDKSSEADNEKTTAKPKAESMVSVTIQQDTSSIPPMTTPM
nr:hypothetical protein [Tanacetum cinerariifolium]